VGARRRPAAARLAAGVTDEELRTDSDLHRLRADQRGREGDAMDRVADLMEQHGYRTTAELVEALNRGAVSLSDDDIEALLVAGVMQHDNRDEA